MKTISYTQHKKVMEYWQKELKKVEEQLRKARLVIIEVTDKNVKLMKEIEKIKLPL